MRLNNRQKRFFGAALTLIVFIGAIIVLVLVMSGCGVHPTKTDDGSTTFAIIQLPDGTIRQGNVVKFTRWSDCCTEMQFENDDCVYEVHPINVVIIEKKEE